jgi:hypothetical protein
VLKIERHKNRQLDFFRQWLDVLPRLVIEISDGHIRAERMEGLSTPPRSIGRWQYQLPTLSFL